MILYRLNRIYRLLLITILVSWFVFLISAIVMISQNSAGNLPYILGIFGIAEFVLLFLTGVYGMTARKKAAGETEDTYEEVLAGLMQKAAENPKKIQTKMRRLNRLGNLYAFELILIILLTILGLGMICIRTGSSMGGFGTFLVALLGILYIIFRTIYIKPEYPEGITVDAEHYPELFRVINSAVTETNANPIDRIYISEDANAAVSFCPSGFGLGGKNLILLGILTLGILNENELKSIIIHELSHIYNKDTRISSRISNNISRWMNIVDRSGNLISNILLIPFADSYINTMNLHLAAIAKTKETIADKEAAAYTGVPTYATACMKLELMELYNKDAYALEEARMGNEPPRNYYSMLLVSFFKEFSKHNAAWIQRIKKRVSSNYDTHPSFKERMQALGIEDYTYPVVFTFENSNYRAEINSIIDTKNQEFYEALSDDWSEYTEEYRKQLEIINRYKETDDPESNFEYAMALEDIGKRDLACVIYEKIINKTADYPPALYRLGQLLLNKNDIVGIEYVKKAVDLNSDLITPGLELIGEYLMSNGLLKERDLLLSWVKDKTSLADHIQQETNQILSDDVFIENDLEQDMIDKITEILNEYKVTRAYFVKKQFQYSSDNCYVLALAFHSLLSKRKALAAINEITEKIGSLDLNCFILNLNDNPAFYRTYKHVPNSEILSPGRNSNIK